MIPNEKKELIKNLTEISDIDIYRILSNEIKDMFINKKMKVTLIHSLLEKELNKKLSINSLRKFIRKFINTNTNKSKLKKELKEKENKGDNMENKIVVGLINFKGGVGKSTIANLLDYEGSIIINIDMQNSEEINTGERTIDYFTQKEELGVETPSELIELLKNEGIDLIFIDTPGAVTEEFLDVLPLMDYVIIVANPNMRDVSQTINTLIELSDLKAKIIILYNKWQTKEELQEAKEILDEVARKEFKNKFIGSTDLKYSRAIPTIDKTQKSIMELSAINKVAYIQARKNILRLKDEIAKMIGVKE